MSNNLSTPIPISPLQQYREQAKKEEEQRLSPFAAFSKNHNRLSEEQEDHRLPYKRDVDRILFSKAYSRYGDKTQVVYLVDNDHLTRRNLHVQMVSAFARGLANILRLNTDLVEAIALGHDVGHPPFGHEGENYLSELSLEYDNGPFLHPLQSCRLMSEIENLNLGLAVFDGFLCHDGGMNGTVLKPEHNKSWKDHEREKQNKKKNPEKNILPGTLEGCLVKICDTISYVGRDIEDAINLGIITRDQVPSNHLGKTNSEILAALSADIVENSAGKDYIALSQACYDELKILRKFNFQYIYINPRLKVESAKIRQGYRILFEWLLRDLNQNPKKSYLWENYLHKRSSSYLADTPPVQKVVDYISGMTDSFFVRSLEKIFLPQKIELY